MDHSLPQAQIEHLATVTHGFVGADLAALCNEAAMACLRRYIAHKRSFHNVDLKGTSQGCNNNSYVSVDNPHCLKTSEEQCLEDHADSESSTLRDHMKSPDSVLSSCSSEVATENECDVEDASVNSTSCTTDTGEVDLKVSFEDFEKAKMRVRPSAMREAVDHRFFASQSNPALHQAIASPIYRSSSDEECADMDWNSLGFSLVPTDFIYTMKCSTEVNFIKGQLCRYGNIELSPAACVLNYEHGLFDGMKAYKRQDGRLVLFRPEQNALWMQMVADRMCMLSPSLEQFIYAVKQTALAPPSAG